MQATRIIDQTEAYIRNLFQADTTGHDWWHVYRVWTIARRIAKLESANLFLVQMAALLHDLGDYKLSVSGEEQAAEAITEYLAEFGLPEKVVQEIIYIVDKVSFSKNVGKKEQVSLEAQIVRDADRLDALGAIGIGRAFAYGGAKGRQFYDPLIKPATFASVAERRQAQGTTINHFYEKLFLIKDLLHTKTAKTMAEKRHQFMEQFLEEFYAEWEGKA